MSNTSMFNPDTFLSDQIEGEMSTSLPPIPEMEEATLVCKEVKVRVTGQNQEYVVMDVTWIVDEEVARTVTGMTEPTVRQGIFLDITEAGGLDTSEGKNVGLGRVREACNQNSAGAWSPASLEGSVCIGQITQRPSDKDDRIFNDVKSLRAA